MMFGDVRLICVRKTIGDARDDISAGLEVEKYHPSLPTNGGSPTTDVDYSTEEASGVLVQVDGQRQHASDSEELKKKGVYFADLHTALQEQPELSSVPTS